MERTCIKEIEGEFDGEDMISDSGKIIKVPGNYSSKSKLVMGDRLVYRISDDGWSFFKQIKLMERKSTIAKVTPIFCGLAAKAEVDGHIINFRISIESQNYYGLEEGDEVVIAFPADILERISIINTMQPELKEQVKLWCAVENRL